MENEVVQGSSPPPAPTSSPSKPDTNRSNAGEAINHMIQGKRHLLVHDIPSAVSSLQKACQLLAEIYGQLANECGEAYFYYGQALLQQAREETGIFSKSLDRDEEDDSDSNEDSQDDENETQSETDQNEDGSEDSEAKEEDIGEKSDDTESVPEVGTTASCEGDPNGEPQPGPSSGTPTSSDPKKDEEDIPSLQLSWETLEVAKVIFMRQAEGNTDMKLKLAQTHLHLGEVGMESENYKQAVDDVQQCLNLQTPILSPDDRALAETYYQLGLAYSFDEEFDQAIENFKNAVNVIECRIKNLLVIAQSPEKELVKDSFATDDDPVYAAKRELEDLRGLLPDIQEKVIDIEDMKSRAEASSLAVTQKSEAAVPLQSQEIPSSSSSKPVMNIGHLVKRKRKPDDEVLTESKKSRPCNSADQACSSSSGSSSFTASKHQMPAVSNSLDITLSDGFGVRMDRNQITSNLPECHSSGSISCDAMAACGSEADDGITSSEASSKPNAISVRKDENSDMDDVDDQVVSQSTNGSGSSSSGTISRRHGMDEVTDSTARCASSPADDQEVPVVSSSKQLDPKQTSVQAS